MDQNIKKTIISIILPVYNGEKYLKLAIESVLKQTFTNFELLIIDDGSSDNSLNIAKSFTDSRIRIIHRENRGLIHTLNEGIALSQSTYVARIDADDIWSDENKLSKQIEYIKQNSNCVLIGTWAKIIDEDNNTKTYLRNPATDSKIRSKILIKNCFIHPSVLFRKDICIKAGGFLENEKYAEDYGLWLRIGQYGMLANIPKYLMSYRVHKGSVTVQKNLEQTKNCLEIIKKYKNVYPNYFIAAIKWNLKILLLRIVGLKNLSKIKKLFVGI